jgi:hypothetical protein
VLSVRFEPGLAGFWVEGGERVTVDRDGGLSVAADPPDGRDGDVCTVWHRSPFAGNIAVSFDARVEQSSIAANNINFFLHYTDPSGIDLVESRHSRDDASYVRYHELSGYIFTFLNDRHGEAPPGAEGEPVARLRIRRCPGFELLAERYGYHCRQQVPYHIEISARNGSLEFSVDGSISLTAHDENPLDGGYFGFRTFRSHVVWSNLLIREI